MKQVFQENDVVYHNLHGKGRVVRIYAGPSCLVHFVDLGYDVNCHPNALSFTPWPAPNHERPLKDGLYRKSSAAAYDNVVRRNNGVFYYYLNGNPSYRISEEIVANSKFEYIGE